MKQNSDHTQNISSNLPDQRTENSEQRQRPENRFKAMGQMLATTKCRHNGQHLPTSGAVSGSAAPASAPKKNTANGWILREGLQKGGIRGKEAPHLEHLYVYAVYELCRRKF